jgi:hypothetical protein
VIFNLNESVSKYKNKEFFHYLSSLTAENEKDENLFASEFLTSLLENENDIPTENEEEELTSKHEEDQDKMSKISSTKHKSVTQT